MKRITFLVTNIYTCGGVQRVVSTLANELAKKQYDISICSVFKTANSPYFSLDKNINVKNVFDDPFNLKKGFFKSTIGIRKFLRINPTDILIFSGIGYASIIMLATLGIKNMKVIAWEHQSFGYGKKFGLEWIGKRIASRFMDSVVVLTEEDYKDYKLNLRNIKNLKQIYNPINKAKAINEYNIDSKYLISCGSIVKQKGFDYAIEVAKKIFKKYPDWQWHIYGDGKEKTTIENMINKYKLSENLILKGYCDNIDEKYKDYSIYVMTSRHEGFPMVLLEAKSNKLPIVSFDCKCGPSEIIEDGINGYLIQCFEVDDMANKVMDLIENNEKRKSFSDKSNLKIDDLDIDKIISQWEELISII